MTDLGRPSVMTPQIIDTLEEAFIWGASDLEACLYAGIGKTALYEYQKVNPDFTERKHLLKNSPALQARRNISAQLAMGDIGTSKWYLERKRKDEFSTSQDLNLGGQPDGTPLSLEVKFVDANRTTE